MYEGLSEIRDICISIIPKNIKLLHPLDPGLEVSKIISSTIFYKPRPRKHRFFKLRTRQSTTPLEKSGPRAFIPFSCHHLCTAQPSSASLKLSYTISSLHATLTNTPTPGTPSATTNTTYGPGGATFLLGGIFTVTLCCVPPGTNPTTSSTAMRIPMCRLCVTKPPW